MIIDAKRSDTITITPELFQYDDYMRELRHRYGYSPEPFYGVNEDDEPIEVHISYSEVTVITYQHDHWIRHNIYKKDGTAHEYFEGKW